MLYIIGCTTSLSYAPVILDTANTFFEAKALLVHLLDIASKAYPNEPSYAVAHEVAKNVVLSPNLTEVAVETDGGTYWIKRHAHSSEERDMLSTLTCINEAARLGLGSSEPKHHEAALNDILGCINQNKTLLELLGEE